MSRETDHSRNDRAPRSQRAFDQATQRIEVAERARVLDELERQLVEYIKETAKRLGVHVGDVTLLPTGDVRCIIADLRAKP